MKGNIAMKKWRLEYNFIEKSEDFKFIKYIFSVILIAQNIFIKIKFLKIS